MKVLALLSRIPWPLEKGDKLRAYHHVKSIAEKHEVILVCLSDQKEHPQAREELLKFCDEVHFIRLNKLGILWNLGLSIFNTKPFSVNYFFQSSAQKKVHALIEKHMPRHMFIQLVRTAEYAKKYQLIPSTFDYMDAFSMGAQRRVNKAIPGLKHLLSIEASRLKNYENETFNFFTHKTIISETDRDLIQHPEKSKIEILPNGVDFQTFTKDDSVEKKYQLVFTGNMSYPPT